MDEMQKYKESQAADVINWLFKELRANFSAFKQAWPDKETYMQAKRTWLKAFMFADINRFEQIQAGLKKCYLNPNPFVPSPGEFISWCAPSTKEMGFPDVDDAFFISVKINEQFSNYIHEDEKIDSVIRHAINAIDPMTYRNMNVEQAKKAFKHYYERAIEKYKSGEINITKRLPKPEKVKDTTLNESTTALKALSTMKAFLQNNPVARETRVFDKEKIMPHHKNFDSEYRREFEDYLLSFDELDVPRLSPEYAYARMRLLNQRFPDR